MTRAVSLELLAFNLKLLGRHSRKSLLISAGRLEDKKRMLPAIRRLLTLDVDLYATPGTHRFLQEAGVTSAVIHTHDRSVTTTASRLLILVVKRMEKRREPRSD